MTFAVPVKRVVSPDQSRARDWKACDANALPRCSNSGARPCRRTDKRHRRPFDTDDGSLALQRAGEGVAGNLVQPFPETGAIRARRGYN
jgi:hypothetical protein